MRSLRRVLVLAVILAVAGCKSGNNGGCNTSGGTGLALSAWPKFRKDPGNTGHIEATIADTASERWVFPPRCDRDQPAIATALTSPVITTDGRVVIVARLSEFPTTSRVYQIDPTSGTESGSFDVSLISTAGVIAGSTPVISQDRISVIFADGTLREFNMDGDLLISSPVNGVVTGSPAIDDEGTVFAGANSGVYTSLCASGGARYVLGIGSTESSPALRNGGTVTVDDDLTVIGSNDGNVRAFNIKGDLLWSFSASAAVQSTVVYDVASDLVYGADTSGLVFAVQAEDGRRCRNLTLGLNAPVVASPALVAGTLYVIDTNGVLHALGITAPCDTSSGSAAGLVERWTYASGASVSSSPAVASSADGDPVVVFGADDGAVHAVVDRGDTGAALWTYYTEERGPFGRMSAAIDKAGTVYVTTGAGRLYAIAAAQGGTPTPCSNATVTPTTVAIDTVPPTSIPTSSPAPTDTVASTETPASTPAPTDAPGVSPLPSPSVTPTTSPQP